MSQSTLNNRKQLLHLTWPIFLEAVLFSVIGSVDMLMLTSYDENAIGAVGNVNQVLALFQVVSNIITAGTGILCAQYIGAGRSMQEKQPLIVGALLVNGALGALFSAGAFFGCDLLLDMVRIDSLLRPYATEYLKIVGGFLWVQMIAMTFTVLIRSHGKTKSTMIFSLIMNGTNIVLNMVLIYGYLGFPSMGVSGAAIATAVSKCIACVMAGVYLFAAVLPGMSLRIRWRDTWNSIKTVVAYGSPAAGEQISYTLSKIVVMAMVNSLSAASTNAYTIINTVVGYVYLFSMALGQGTSIIVGWEVGKQRLEEAKKLALFSTRCSFLISLAALTVLTLLRRPVIGLMSDWNEEVIAIGSAVILADFVLEAGRSRNLVLVNSLRAAGDVRFPLYIGLFSMWFFSVGFSWLMGMQLGWELVGIWLGLGLDECFRAVAMQIRWTKGTWMRYAKQS